jgi:hypothetical protein
MLKHRILQGHKVKPDLRGQQVQTERMGKMALKARREFKVFKVKWDLKDQLD